MKKINSELQKFVRGTNNQVLRTGNKCVIYTRVSSKEQAENNTSLDTQKRYCEEYCRKKGYTIKEYFGGTYESAKGDERKEFQKMLQYVGKNKSINTILVYSYDRFSRSGANAAYLSQELQQAGVRVIAVSQEIDTTSPSGRLHRDMLYLFSQFDNELRKDKVVTGMIENLRQGHWVATTPFGYTNLNRKEKARNHNYVINEQGKVLKEGFILKAQGNLNNLEIVQRLRRKGCKINYKSFVRILSNPFYCGYITHSLIPDEIYKGHHPKLVSEELFLSANAVISAQTRSGITKKYKIDDLPLKTFALAELTDEPDDTDGTDCTDGTDNTENTESVPMTGYIKKGIYYYKTRKKGKAVNVNAKRLNNLFLEELAQYEYKGRLKAKLAREIGRIMQIKLEGHFKEESQIVKHLAEIDHKIEQLEQRFVNNEIPKELFEKYLAKFQAEKKVLEQKQPTEKIESSNLKMIIEKGHSIAENISQRWLSANYDNKRRLQSLIFPDGIVYSKKKDRVRTRRVNSFFAEIPRAVSVLEENKNGHPEKNDQNSHWVVPSRIELEYQVPETCVLSIVLRDRGQN